MTDIIADWIPLVITVISGWMLFEFLAICYSARKFRRMRDEER